MTFMLLFEKSMKALKKCYDPIITTLIMCSNRSTKQCHNCGAFWYLYRCYQIASPKGPNDTGKVVAFLALVKAFATLFTIAITLFSASQKPMCRTGR